MSGESRVTRDMLNRRISEVNLGEFVGAIGILFEASGILQPYRPPLQPPRPVFPPSPCDIANAAAFMSFITHEPAKQHWLNIWAEAGALCSRTSLRHGEFRMTLEMLNRAVSDANLGDFLGIVGILFELSGKSYPYHWLFPPSPCVIAKQAAFMEATTFADVEAKVLWSNIWTEADALCQLETP